jgi:hypothetical protein
MFYTIKNPQGLLIHTHISTAPKGAIVSFMQMARGIHRILELRGCSESWEVWEAKGFQVVPIRLQEVVEVTVDAS